MIALIPRSALTSQIASAIISLTLLLFPFGGAKRAFGAEALQPFASFNARVELDIEDGEVEVWASFTPAAGGNPLDLAAEAVTLQVRAALRLTPSRSPPAPSKKTRAEGLASKAPSTG